MVVAKLLVLMPAIRSSVCDATWESELSGDHDANIAKDCAMDALFWARITKLMFVVWPMVKLVKFGGFQKPSLSRLYKHMKDAESLWKELADDEDFEYGDVAKDILQILESDKVALEPSEDEPSEGPSSENRWQLMQSDMALAGYVLDPIFHDEQPWTDAKAMSALRRVAEKELGIDRETGEYDEALMKERMPLFHNQHLQYISKLGQFSRPYVFSKETLEQTHACAWYQSFSGEMPELQFVGTRVTGCVAGADMAETNWKLYKSINTKGRSRLGKVSMDTFTPDACDLDQTTATKLAYVSSNLHVDDFDDYCMSEASKDLNEFTVGDEASLIKIFGDVRKAADVLPDAKYFKCYIEAWERDTAKKNDNVNAMLRDKYTGMILRDSPDDDDEDEDGDEEFIGRITGIEYKKKKEGTLRKGYYLRVSRRVDDSLSLIEPIIESEADTRLYSIDSALATLIVPEDNPTYTFRSDPSTLSLVSPPSLVSHPAGLSGSSSSPNQPIGADAVTI